MPGILRPTRQAIWHGRLHLAVFPPVHQYCTSNLYIYLTGVCVTIYVLASSLLYNDCGCVMTCQLHKKNALTPVTTQFVMLLE